MPPRTAIKGLSAELSEIVGPQNVLTEPRLIEDYRKDMADYEATPAVVIRPSTEAEVRLILRVASRRRMPLVARGAGTSLTGAAVLQVA